MNRQPTSAARIEQLAYVIDALRRQEVRHRQNHWSVPSGIAQLVSEIGFEVSRGQDGSNVDRSCQSEHVGPISPRAVKYETAAQILEVSMSTIKRLVADGRLDAIALGGSKRIPIASIDALVGETEGGK